MIAAELGVFDYFLILTESVPVEFGLPVLAQAAEIIAPWQWAVSWAVATLLIALVVAFDYTTKAGIIARTTTLEAIRQPIFLLTLALSAVFLGVLTWLPFFSLGEDVKMLKDCGLATIQVTSLLIAVWTASTSIADEIEGKTAMTLLSKPINRRQFVVGKYMGIVQAVFWYILPLGLLLLGLIVYKVGYDAKEASAEAPALLVCLAEATQTVPGMVLIFLEVAVLAAISVAISTRMPMVVNLTTCVAIFVVGHLTPQLVASGTIKLEFVQFMARMFATALPSLEVYSVTAAVTTGTMVPPIYLGAALAYSLCYATAAILLAFILFEDRDLA